MSVSDVCKKIAEIKSTIKNAVAQGNKRAGFNENPDFPEVLIELSAAGYHVQKMPSGRCIVEWHDSKDT